MNKNESKYFNTALKMNDALISLLASKDFEYITIKDICEKAGVNRSTFYLHYSNTSDLLEEVIDRLNENVPGTAIQMKNDYEVKVNFDEAKANYIGDGAMKFYYHNNDYFRELNTLYGYDRFCNCQFFYIFKLVLLEYYCLSYF